MQNMDFFSVKRQIPALLTLLLLAGCAGSELTRPEPASPVILTPYATQTPPVKPSLVILPAQATSVILAPTATPSAYTIKKDDTLLEIARRSGVSLAELLAANPGIRSEALSVGQVIQVPAARPPDTLPSPAAADLGQPACFPSGGGVYCFIPVHHPGDGWLENIKVQVALFDAEGRLVASQEALPLLTGLPAGKTLPAVAFFPGVEVATTSQAQLLNSIQTDGARYLSVEIKNLLVAVAWGGLSAQMDGQVRLLPETKPASTIWLAGVAYDVDGNIIGVRRWEWGGSLAPGQALPFAFAVYSAGALIERVEVFAEALP